MALLTLADAHLAFGHVPLLDGASFALDAGERVALIGRNGAGKSSLLKILAGLERPDDGALQLQGGLRRVYVAQEPSFAPGSTVFHAVAEGVAEARALRERYEQHADGEDLDALQSRIEALGGWTWEQRVDAALQRLHLDPQARVQTLSGGTAKRVALARALVAAPEVLLLDEPTNHLDIDAIEWLQDLLVDWRGALLLVSHDRAFIDAVATRIVELDRGVLRSYPGRFAAYEEAKARELNAEALAAARADKLLAQEEAWIRQGVEARRTRSVGRVARLQRLREQRASRRERVGRVRLELDAGAPPGKIVAELQDVTLRFGERLLVERFSATLLRGDKVGLIGPNGCGKTTLLGLLLGETAPDEGRVRHGTNLQVAYFDQQRAQLREDWNALDNVSEGAEFIDTPRGRKHVLGYLQDFLFTPDRARAPITMLSGGERHRLLLAKLLARPCNTLVLDEPTNDLDIETLELLEDMLTEFTGTLIVVSHDRALLDAVVTSLLYVDDRGVVHEMVGGYSECSAEMAAINRAAAPAAVSEVPAPPAPTTTVSRPAATPKPAKLGYREQRELAELPQKMAALESEIAALQENLSDPATYRDRPEAVAELNRSLAERQVELDAALERWVELESRTE